MFCLYADMFNNNDGFIFDRPTEDMFSFIYNGGIVAKDKNENNLKLFRNMHIIGDSIKKLSSHGIPLVCTDLLAFVCGMDTEDEISKLESVKMAEIDKCNIFIELDINKSKTESAYFSKINEAIKAKRQANQNVYVFSYESILKNDIIRRDFLELCKDLHDKEANNIL